MKEEVIAFTDPKSPVSEMFKTLRTNIQFMNTNKPLKTLLVTSTLPNEGKSWTVANLAVTFAQAGKKVLIIDADMRKGRQFGIFEVPPTPGLSNYLSGVIDGESGNYELDEFIKKTELDNLFLMPAGNVPPNPTELLVSEKMINLIGMVSERYDITIFDGTPGLLVADASIISRIVDSSIIVTAHNETKIDNVSEVKKAIENIGGKVAGVVINKIPISSKKYENTYYYGHTAPAIINDKKKKKLNMRRQFFKEEKEDQKIKELEKLQENIIEKIYNKFEQKEEKKYDLHEQTIFEEQQSKENVEPEVKQEESKEVRFGSAIEPAIEKQIIEEQQPKVEEQQQVKDEQQVEEVKQEQEPKSDNQEEISTEEKIIMPVIEEEKIVETVETEQPEEKVIEQPKIEEQFHVEEKVYEEQQPEAEEQFEEVKQEFELQQEAHEEEQLNDVINISEARQQPEEDNYEYVEPKLSWEEEAESAYEQIKREINTIGYEPEQKKEEKKPENIEYQNTEYTLDKTQEILNEINRYLEEQRNNLNNGGSND